MTNLVNVDVVQLPHGADLPLPSYNTPGSAAMDALAAIDQDIVLQPGDWQLIPTGLAMAIPEGFELQIRARSGLTAKHAIIVLNGPATIDSDYRGELKVILANQGKEAFTVTRGMRIAQMVIAPCYHAVWKPAATLPDTERGAGGFGSTGTHG
ncbi:MAG: dUTP diphosphatase [Pseudomonadota bacterium]